jgi:hypothetical protein
MAISIMGGLIVATVLTLAAVPALYALWFRVCRPGETGAGAAGAAKGSASERLKGGLSDSPAGP